MRSIVPIVEGKGDVPSAKKLLQRILSEILNVQDVVVHDPVRISRSAVVQRGKLELAVDIAMRDRRGTSAIVVLLDADDDCPAELGPVLTARTRRHRSDIPTSVVLAKREYEAWFLGSLSSLQGIRGIRSDAGNVPLPEDKRGAKEEIERLMENLHAYSETADQVALTAKFDLDMARRNCPSFDKLIREVERLVSEMNKS